MVTGSNDARAVRIQTAGRTADRHAFLAAGSGSVRYVIDKTFVIFMNSQAGRYGELNATRLCRAVLEHGLENILARANETFDPALDS